MLQNPLRSPAAHLFHLATLASTVVAASAILGACGSNTPGRQSSGAAGEESGGNSNGEGQGEKAGSESTAGAGGTRQGSERSPGPSGTSGGSGTQKTEPGVGGKEEPGEEPAGVFIEPTKPAEEVPINDAGPKRPMVCNDAGQCSCMNIASLGKLGSYGVGNDNTSVFQKWLNDNSSAHVDVMTEHTTLTRDLLKKYDVLILQGLEEGNAGAPPYWVFSDSEIRAVEQWVKEDGGGLISLIGYGAEGGEVDPINSLLKFSGISYAKEDVFSEGSGLEYCWGNTIAVSDWRSDDAISTAISAHIQKIGVYHGRPIDVGSSGASVVAAHREGSKEIVVAAAKVVGNGRVFVFGDEWVTYTSQWSDLGQESKIDTYNPCYSPEAGVMRTAEVEFQVPQFWYNVISWDSTAQCPLTFKPEIPIIPR